MNLPYNRGRRGAFVPSGGREREPIVGDHKELRVKDFLSFIGGAALGAAVGAGIIIFATPKSGSETRQSISDHWNGALELGRRAAREREQELWADFNTRVRAPAGMPLLDSTNGHVVDLPTAV